MHKTKNCIITCIDFRLQGSYSNLIKSRDWLGESDVISLAGCSRDLVKPLQEFHKDALLRQLELSITLHDPDKIIFLDHQDCGGYAQDETIPQGLPIDEDLKQHIEWGNRARTVVEELYPVKTVEVYFVHLDGEVEMII